MGPYAKPMEGQELLSFLFGGGRKKLRKCIFGRDYSIPAYCNSLGYRKLSQRLHVLLLWWSGTVVTALRSLKSGVREYISPRINFRLYLLLKLTGKEAKIVDKRHWQLYSQCCCGSGKLTSHDLPGHSEIHQGLGPYGPWCSYTTG